MTGVTLAIPGQGTAQLLPGTENGEWHYIGGDAGHTRYSPLDQINASNFGELEIAWVWTGDNFGPMSLDVSRSTPLYVNGKLFTVAGSRRTVAAIDPATGETLWTFREPNTRRWEYSMRAGHGKGVAYAEVDGRAVIYVITPGFFLHALDAETGEHLESWGKEVAIEGFPKTGVVDLIPDLISDWGPWQQWEGDPYDPAEGIPLELGYITSSSPPIVVNGVVVVGNSAEQGYNQTRIENVPGDIMGFDARTGEHLWKFHVLPRPGEFGHDTWENDAWQTTGDISSWAPLSADPGRGLVYVATNGSTGDYFSGFRPGANLFGNSVIALDVRTGRRVWHYQLIHHDLWNYDNSVPPLLMDITREGQNVPIVVQTNKTAFAYVFNRETGEPVWPIEERPVPQTEVPGEWSSPTQPHPTWPLPVDMQGLDENELIDFTPELRQQALEIVKNYRIGPLFNPPLHIDNAAGVIGASRCSSPGNIWNPPAADPATGIYYMPSRKRCGGNLLIPGAEADSLVAEPAGKTLMRYASGASIGLSGPQGLPLYKPPYSRITAIDMNTGEHLWWIPVGETPDRIKNHPALQGVSLPNTGWGEAAPMVTATLLLFGEGADGRPLLHAVDKATGATIGTKDLPASAQYGMMSYMHEGFQHIVVQVAGRGTPGSLVALRLPGFPPPRQAGSTE